MRENVDGLGRKKKSKRESEIVKTNYFIFFFKQKTAYEIVSRDWSSDVCSSDLPFIANPDLVYRMKVGAEMQQPDFDTFYTPGEKGYTDYPTLEEAETAE